MLVGMFIFSLIICNGILLMDSMNPLPLPFAMHMTVMFTCALVPITTGIVLLMRIISTGSYLFIDFARHGEVILDNKRRGRRAKFIKGWLTDLELIRAKNKIFKDTGGGYIIAGHDVRHTHETLGHDLPENIAQYIYKIKKKYMVDDLPELMALAKKLGGIQEKKKVKEKIIVDGVEKDYEATLSIKEQLEKIPELDAAMANPETKEELLSMTARDLQKMSEYLFDGETVHYEDFENFVDSVSPNELESFMNQHVSHRIMQAKAYSLTGQTDWAKYVLPITILFIGGALAWQMLSG